MWRPFQQNHAIERVRVILSFKSKLPPKFIRKLAIDREADRVNLGFTTKNNREVHDITFELDKPHVESRSTKLVGWDWQKVSAGNVPLEGLIVEESMIGYETGAYDRWTGFSDRFREVVEPTLRDVSGVTDLAAISLEFFDKFVFLGDAHKAKPTEVLLGLEHLLPEEATSGQELWHLHRGWFEKINDYTTLINQNFDGQNGSFPDGRVARAIQILTKCEMREGDAVIDFERLNGHLGDMHTRSKALFRGALAPEMIKLVGLAE